MERIKIEEADAKTLRYFAEVTMGLEIKDGTNAAQIRAKLKQAGYAADTIPAPAAPPEPIVQYVQVPAAAPAPVLAASDGEQVERPAAVSRPASAALMHPSQDPKVLLTVHKTDDKRRARDVVVGVNGDIFQIRRGTKVDVPYRVYLALENAKEKAAVPHETEVNKITGEPIMVWEDVYSYSFDVHRMPSDEEIAAWEHATGAGFKNVA